jgi:hypothetical protein
MAKDTASKTQSDDVIVSTADGTFYKVARQKLQEFRLPEGTVLLGNSSGSLFAVPQDRLAEFQMSKEDGWRALRLYRSELRQRLRGVGSGPPRFLSRRSFGPRGPFARGPRPWR